MVLLFELLVLFVFSASPGPGTVFSSPSRFTSSSLPPFYAALLDAWCVCHGSFRPHAGIGLGIAFQPLSSLSTKSAYLYLLSELASSPHCVEKFLPSFGPFYWHATWRQLCFLPLDRPVIDLSWQAAHGVLYTAERLISFGYDIPSACFCGHGVESLEHLFFSCPHASSVFSWVQSLLFHISPVVLVFFPVVFYLAFWAMNFVLCQAFLSISSMCASLSFGCPVVIFAFVTSSHPLLMLLNLSRVRFYLPIFGARFSSSRRRRFFVRQWGARGIFASFVGSSVIVTL